MMTCRTCGHGALHLELDVGSASFCVDAPTSRTAARDIPKHPFRLGTCHACGVIQLLDLPPLEALRPAGPAILYRDPERHLQDLACVSSSLLGSPAAQVMGMSYKDTPLMDQLAVQGMTNLRLLDREADWGLADHRAGIETMQARCTVDWADSVRRKHGRADLLLVRHVLEHAHHFSEFVAACRRLTEPDGLVLFEVPGCETEFARGDAGALWEEHVSYFTMGSLRRSLAVHGFHSLVIDNYPYTVEDCLVAVGRFESPSPLATTVQTPLLQEFQRANSLIQTRLRTLSSICRQRGQGIAVYGAGHRTATWLELAGLADVVNCVIDDDPAKQGRYLAGSGIEIGPATLLQERNIQFCIGLLSTDILRRIASREAEYIDRGGRFLTLDQILAGVQ